MPVLDQTDFRNLQEKIVARLRKGLASDLYYHGPEHTLDVLLACRRIAKAEGVNGADLQLLELAALYHDNGFLEAYGGHEEVGCRYAKEELPEYGFSDAQISQVCETIMATRIPQTPQDALGEIICDADLDYLGREDFWEIGDALYREFLSRGIVAEDKEWNRLQLDFLQNHSYFTWVSREEREPRKQIHLNKIKEIVEAYDSES